MQIKTVNTDGLRQHPLNKKLYSNDWGEDGATLLDSVKQFGILSPIVTTKDRVVVSGHRRLIAAKRLKIHRVPIIMLDFESELHVREAVIHANRQRQKSNVEIAREYRELKRIETERAKARQSEAGGRNPGKKSGGGKLSTSGDDDTGKARDKAAADLGISGRQGEKMGQVADKIDELRESGQDGAADELEETLNKSVNAAHKQVKSTKPKADKPKPAKESPPASDDLTVYFNSLRSYEAQQALETLATIYTDHPTVALNGTRILDEMQQRDIRAWLGEKAA